MLRLLVRSLFVPGSWNYRTLIGTGIAWALIPAEASRPRRAEVLDSGESFNAHPYLTPVALGALTAGERDGTDPEQIRRFRAALRSPLGSLGDKLVWGAWRPFCLLAGVLAALLGGGPGLVVGGLLVLYNLVHIGLRAWGVSAGLRMGLDVATALRRVAMAEKAERIAVAGVLLSGILCGVLLGEAPTIPGRTLLWVSGGSALLLAGFLGGEGVRKSAPALLLVIVLTGLALLPGLAPTGPG